MDVLGLDYKVLDFAFRLYRIPEEEQRLTFEKIDVMNREVCKHRSEQQKTLAEQREQQALAARGIHRVDK